MRVLFALSLGAFMGSLLQSDLKSLPYTRTFLYLLTEKQAELFCGLQQSDRETQYLLEWLE